MDLSTSINAFNTEYNIDAIREHNKLLQGQASFEFDDMSKTSFQEALDKAFTSTPLKHSAEPTTGNYLEQIAKSFGDGLNSVNKARIDADRMQEDIAMGGPTSIHDAMIAAEKAELSMRMAIQVRNRILNAYNEINAMGV